jgi:hypothetical protein
VDELDTKNQDISSLIEQIRKLKISLKEERGNHIVYHVEELTSSICERAYFSHLTIAKEFELENCKKIITDLSK